MFLGFFYFLQTPTLNPCNLLKYSQLTIQTPTLTLTCDLPKTYPYTYCITTDNRKQS